MFVSASVDLKLHSYDESQLKTYPVKSPPSLARIIKISISVDNAYIAVLRQDQRAQLFSVEDLTNVQLIHTFNVSNVTAVAFQRQTKKIALGTRAGDILIHDIETQTVSDLQRNVAMSVENLDFTFNDQHLCGTYTNTFFAYSDVQNSPLKTYTQDSLCSTMKCHHLIPNCALVGCKNGNVTVLNVEDGTELIQIMALQTSVFALAMSSCGSYLFVAGRQVKTYVVDYETKSCILQYDFEEERPVTALDVSRDDRNLAIGLDNGTIKLYDFQEGLREVQCRKIHTFAITLIVFENKHKVINLFFNHDMKETESSAASCSKTPSASTNHQDKIMEELTRDIKLQIKTEMDEFEAEMEKCCQKYQQFFDYEFEALKKTFSETWGVFSSGDMNKIIQALSKEEPPRGHK